MREIPRKKSFLTRNKKEKKERGPMPTKYNLKEMLEYKRPAYDRYTQKFCNRYLLPVFGQPDAHGNYVKIIGNQPEIAFMAHHDTVHKTGGKQTVYDHAGNYFVTSDCLGADCTTGVYIILRMIEKGIPGVYVVHAAEEIGCIGSRALVKDNPSWLKHVKAAISFDRKGYSSVVTHQLGTRTCSDAFGESLCDLLGLSYKLDKGGVYTDSNEYAHVVPECTNISVGYFQQHTANEYQDYEFLEILVDILLNANWNSLVFERDPKSFEEDSGWYGKSTYSTFGVNGWETRARDWDTDDSVVEENNSDEYELDLMADAIKTNSKEVAQILMDYGFSLYDLMDEIQDKGANIRSINF